MPSACHGTAQIRATCSGLSATGRVGEHPRNGASDFAPIAGVGLVKPARPDQKFNLLGADAGHGGHHLPVALSRPVALPAIGLASCGGGAIEHGASLLPAPARPNEIIAPP